MKKVTLKKLFSQGYIVLFFIGLLCATIASSIVASEENTSAPKTFSHLTSKESLYVIKQLSYSHTNLADFCNTSSQFSDKEKCDDLIHRIHNEKRDSWKSTGLALRLFIELEIDKGKAKDCKEDCADPLEYQKCVHNVEKRLSYAFISLRNNLQNEKDES